MLKNKASDLHISAGSTPKIRKHGAKLCLKKNIIMGRNTVVTKKKTKLNSSKKLQKSGYARRYNFSFLISPQNLLD